MPNVAYPRLRSTAPIAAILVALLGRPVAIRAGGFHIQTRQLIENGKTVSRTTVSHGATGGKPLLKLEMRARSDGSARSLNVSPDRAAGPLRRSFFNRLSFGFLGSQTRTSVQQTATGFRIVVERGRHLRSEKRKNV